MSTLSPKEIVNKVWDLIPKIAQKEWLELEEQYDILEEWAWVRTRLKPRLIRVYHAFFKEITPESKPIEVASVIERQDRIVEILGILVVHGGINTDTSFDAVQAAMQKQFKISKVKKTETAHSFDSWVISFVKHKAKYAKIDVFVCGKSREEAELDAWRKLADYMGN